MGVFLGLATAAARDAELKAAFSDSVFAAAASRTA